MIVNPAASKKKEESTGKERTPPGKAPPQPAPASGNAKPKAPENTTETGIAFKMSEEERLKRANGLIEEYWSQGDLEEMLTSLVELGSAIIKPLVMKILSKYIDCAKTSLQEKLETLLKEDGIVAVLSDNVGEVQAGVQCCEYLQLLSDTVTDCRQAPEQLGTVVGHLVRANACTTEWLLELVQTDIAINVDDLMEDQDVCITLYNRFMDRVGTITGGK